MKNKKKSSFGVRMQALKEQRKREAKDKELLDRFPQQSPLDARTEIVTVAPMISSTSDTPATVVTIRKIPTALELTIARLREQAQNLK